MQGKLHNFSSGSCAPGIRLMELVANDIRVDRQGVDVELMSFPWYAETLKDISAMYACCNYGK